MNPKKAPLELLTKEMRALLLEVGLMGYSGGFESEAIAYFYKLRIMDPDSSHASLLLAQMHMFNQEFEQAEQILLEVEISSIGSDPWVSQMVHAVRQSGIQLSKTFATREAE